MLTFIPIPDMAALEAKHAHPDRQQPVSNIDRESNAPAPKDFLWTMCYFGQSGIAWPVSNNAPSGKFVSCSEGHDEVLGFCRYSLGSDQMLEPDSGSIQY